MSTCPPFETLVALWSGEIGEAEAVLVDEHLFTCDSCAAATERLAHVVGGLRAKMPFVISRAHHDRLVASGTRVAVTTADPTSDRTAEKTARFTPDVDLLVFALRGDVSKADRVDVEIASPTGSPSYLLEDVPFDRAKGEVLIACQRHYEGMFPAGDPIFSVHAVEAGTRRTVGDYVINHVWR
jgi:hypothetical protein